MSKKWFLVIAISFLLNIALLVYTASSLKTKKTTELSPNTSNLDYEYLSRRIFAQNQNDLLINFVNLRNNLHTYQDDKGERLGIYFEYLPTGNSIGINEKKEFVLASLLKVPLVMAVYKNIEMGKFNENDILEVKKENLDPFFGDLWTKGVGTKITVLEAVRLSLVESDNTAMNLLFHKVVQGSLENVFDSLDIPKVLGENTPVVSPKNYSSILRSLYLASYLQREASNNILNLLTQSTFNDQIRKGVPGNVKVAHKIGTYEPNNPDKSIYTDCGIVYLPLRPYILCVMTRADMEVASKWTSEVSKIVYDFVASANK